MYICPCHCLNLSQLTFPLHSYRGPQLLWAQALHVRSAFVGNKNKRKFPSETLVPAPPAWQEVDPGPVKAAPLWGMLAQAVPLDPGDWPTFARSPAGSFLLGERSLWEKTWGWFQMSPGIILLVGGHSPLAEWPCRVRETSGQQVGFILLVSFCWRSNSFWAPALFTCLFKKKSWSARCRRNGEEASMG